MVTLLPYGLRLALALLAWHAAKALVRHTWRNEAPAASAAAALRILVHAAAAGAVWQALP